MLRRVTARSFLSTTMKLTKRCLPCIASVFNAPEWSMCARALGIEVHGGAVVSAVSGRFGVRTVTITDHSADHSADHGAGHRRRRIAADCLLISGGHSPQTSLSSQLGFDLRWQESIAAFVPDLASGRFAAATSEVVGAARGVFGLAAAAGDGADHLQELPPDPVATPIVPLWEVAGRGKAFVDLQNDVTTADVRLAAREGYEHVEHMKRYTTHGMATDQGRIGGLVGSAVLAQARGVPVAAVGQSRPRPFTQAVPLAALAGGEVGQHFKPKRRLPLHDWHESAGATFVTTGLWLRPLLYGQPGAAHSGWEPVLNEARTVRRAVGITDVSSLGKIDVQGADAARFLDFVYANTLSTLKIGRARYGIMLREDGMLFDDGTTARLGSEHFVVTTTTANSTAVLEHLEFQLQANCPQFDVLLTDVGDQWAQFAVAGPRSREVVSAVVADIDVSNASFPFMAASQARISGIARSRAGIWHCAVRTRRAQYTANREKTRHRCRTQWQHQRRRSGIWPDVEAGRGLRRPLPVEASRLEFVKSIAAGRSAAG